ncbi:hypothetical protein ACFQZ4_35060 [Catellatospora coxensis]
MTVASDREKIAELLTSVEELEDVARTLDDERRTRLLRIARRWLATCEPIRPVIAAELLELSEPTVREWARAGVFLIVQVNGQSRLEPRRFHEVWHLVKDLRQAGQTRGCSTPCGATWRTPRCWNATTSGRASRRCSAARARPSTSTGCSRVRGRARPRQVTCPSPSTGRPAPSSSSTACATASSSRSPSSCATSKRRAARPSATASPAGPRSTACA